MIVLNVNVNDMRWLAHAATSRFKLWQNKDIFLTITHSYTQKFKLWLSKGKERKFSGTLESLSYLTVPWMPLWAENWMDSVGYIFNNPTKTIYND